MPIDIATVVLLIALGMAAGALGTFLGIGGGSIVSPMLIALGIEPHIAVSSSLTTVIGTSLGGLAKLYRAGLVRARLALLLEVATTIGAATGSTIAVRLSGKIVVAIVAIALAIAGTIALLQPWIKPRGGIPTALAISFFAGILSATTGIGGGVIKMPTMIAVLGLDIRSALATSKMMVGITASIGLCSYIINDLFDPCIALPLALGAYLGASLSARVVVKARRKILRVVAGTLYYLLTAITVAKLLTLR